MTLRTEMYVDFAERLQIAMSAKAINLSPTVRAKLVNVSFDGQSVTTNTVCSLLLEKSMPTQDKLICLAKLLGTSSEQLRYGRYSEKTLMIGNQDGSETELTESQQQLVRKYIMLNTCQQKLVSDLDDEISG